MKTKHFIKSAISGFLAAIMTIGTIPAISVSAAQVNEYIDPADVWITSNGRTNELDFNATITQETGWCPVCNKDTIMLTYRTPEYTKAGSTALNRGVKFSDGTMTDGVTHGNVDDGRPGVDASYTTYHWTKSVCQVCGTLNSADGEGDYSFGKNVYGLNSCDLDFFLDFDNTTYTTYDSDYHTTVLKKGQYCQFCKGTKARATEKKEAHNFDETVISELGNQRFHLTGECEDCGYTKNEYAAAKSVVQSYYGKVDGKAHTVTVSDLSDKGVHTSIRYGTSASKCNLTSAPNYTEEGYYPVYYEIDYSYDGESMTENGVSYVWLLADSSNNSATAMNWITGYSDGTFRPDNNITRAEVVTIVNRVTGREADTDYINKNMSAVNTFTDLKDKAYWAYYEILEAANTHNIINGSNGETWVK
ncbi:MAG: S-layer homology domain-containing protein [Oscillospiraceae bacterium]|nr:S-layer homology domain-containing protein [Oscillospiraceae bacterium]